MFIGVLNGVYLMATTVGCSEGTIKKFGRLSISVLEFSCHGTGMQFTLALPPQERIYCRELVLSLIIM